MRRYAIQKIKMVDLENMEPNGVVFLMPAEKSLKNFDKYLNKKEKQFYRSMSDTERLSLHLSCDPFNAFAFLMKWRSK